MYRMNFPARKEARQKEALERQAKHDALSPDQKFANALGSRERDRLRKQIEKKVESAKTTPKSEK